MTTDHELATQERFNREMDVQRALGHLTHEQCERAKHHFVVDEGWKHPTTEVDWEAWDLQAATGDYPPVI